MRSRASVSAASPRAAGADGPVVSGLGDPRRGAAAEHDVGVFARYFIELPIDPERVERALTQAPGCVAPRAWRARRTTAGTRSSPRSGSAIASGSHARSRSSSEIRSTRRARWCSRCDGRRRTRPGLFPALEADLEVAPLPPDRTQLGDERALRAAAGAARQGDRPRHPVPRRGGDAQGLPRPGRGGARAAGPTAMGPIRTPHRRWRASMPS